MDTPETKKKREKCLFSKCCSMTEQLQRACSLCVCLCVHAQLGIRL